jgi:hypothetical protein
MILSKGIVGAALLFIFGQLIIATPVWAACGGGSPNLMAASANYADVSACLTAARDGDTVTVPAGSATWTAALNITKYVKLIASGTVTITDNSPGEEGGSLIIIQESAAGSTTLQGFTFVQGTSVHKGAQGIVNISNFGGSGAPIIIKGNTFTQGWSGNAINAHTNRGVITGNTFTGTVSGGNCFNNTSALRHKPTHMGASWTTPLFYGAADTSGNENLYFENNTLRFVAEAIDCDDNCRIVIRYNTWTSSGIISHGVDTSGIYGGRFMDIYQNRFVRDTTPQASCGGLIANIGSGIGVRGGVVLVHDNPQMDDQSTSTWGKQSNLTFLMEPPYRYGGGYPCWDTVTATGVGYPFPHQAGWGYTTGATSVTGPNCPNCPVRQDKEPVYIWNNAGTGNYNSPWVAGYGWSVPTSDCPSQTKPFSTWMQAGRDYFTNTPKPGYTPYTYPHPLTGGIATVPAPTATVPVPTGLTVR